MKNQKFSQEEYDFFIDNGFVVLEQCFDVGPGSTVERWLRESWARAGLDPDDPDGWPSKALVLPRTEEVPVKDFAPRAYDAICKLLGGEDRLKNKNFCWGNNFLMNYAAGSDQPWVPCSAKSPEGINWHVDGNWFKHFLDSPEQGILGIVLFSDMQSKAGCTCFSPDSVAPVARALLDHPEGLKPYDFNWDEIIHQCSDFRECIGRAGDVVLVHPFMMHRGSQNLKKIPRFMCNIVTSMAEPMNFNRPDGRYNAMEQVILNALDLDSLDFQITGQREHLGPGQRR